jgi:hypothetical protein
MKMFYLKGLIHMFSESTGLQVNFAKSFLVPINVPFEKATTLVKPLVVRWDSYLSPTLACLLEPQSPKLMIFIP